MDAFILVLALHARLSSISYSKERLMFMSVTSCTFTGARNPYIVVVTSIFLGGDLLPVLLVTTVLPPPPSDCDRSPS